jgi:lysophospholipase L1-like esterase
VKKWLKNIFALFFGLGIAVMLLEIFLRFYNPLNTRFTNGEIKLPANIVYKINNTEISQLSSKIIHSKNSLGFRGPEVIDTSGRVKIICIGGSTTECFYLNDGQDWPAVWQASLGKKYWINNAGLDGHSSFGHLVLLRNHIINLRPKYVVFLVGCNDVAASQINNYEKEFLQGPKRWLEYSEIFNVITAIKRAKKAQNFGIHHQSINLLEQIIADTTGWNKELKPGKLLEYKKRLQQLVKICIKAKITPIFCTQPSILTAREINRVFVGNRNFQGESAMHYAYQLKQFNNITKDICIENRLQFIDLETKLEPSQTYYYDYFRYTPEGARAIAKILSDEIKL